MNKLAIETVEDFIYCLNSKDWKHLVNFCQRTWIGKTDRPADHLKAKFEHLTIDNSITINTLRTKGLNPKFIIDVHIAYSLPVQNVSFRMIKENIYGIPAIDGSWGVNPDSFRTVQKKSKAVKLSIFKRLIKKLGRK